MTRIKKFLKNYKLSIPAGIVVLIIIFVIMSRSGGTQVKAESITTAKGIVAQEISVTGRVHAAQEVELAVQTGGRVSSIAGKVGKEVKAGEVILKVDTSDLQIRLGRQQAALAKVKLAYENQAPGASNASSDLKKAYEDGFNTIADTFLDIPSIIGDLDDMLNDPSHSSYLDNEAIRPVGATALDTKLELAKDFRIAQEKYNILLPKYRALNRNSSSVELEAMLTDTYNLTKEIADIIKDTHNLIDYIEDKSNFTLPAQLNTDQATLDDHTSETNTHLSALLAIKDDIKQAREGISSEANNTTSSQIDIRQAELDIQDTLVQINNRTIKAPVDGVVTAINAEVGETISPSTAVVSIISVNQFEIEASVPEADVAKIQVGADTDVTLDAYGNDVIFKAKVVSVDPGERIVDGVATYKTTFQFVEKDNRIKSGMTASLIVKGERKENVIAISQRAVITKDGAKHVQVLVNGKIVEKPVQTGLRGSNGNIEITSGLTVGEQVVVFSEK